MRILQFSVFELDEESRELTRNGRRVAITHQAFVVLWILASRAGMVVTRDELRRALWSDDTHVDFERSLNFVVASVRRVIGDDARRPMFIETATKRGYRFIAGVRVKATDRAAVPVQIRAPAADLVAARPGWTASWRRWVLAAAIPIMCTQGSELVRAHTRATATPLAIAAFERGDYESAAAYDSRFAEAHFALASQYKMLGEMRAIAPRVALERARSSTRRAIALEDAPETRSLLGTLRLALDWDVDGARDDAARALAAAPDWDIGLSTFAQILSAAGDDRAALDAIARAEALSPSCDLLAWDSAVLNFRARRYDVALEAIRRARRLGSLSGRAADRDWIARLHELSLKIYAHQGQWVDAQREAAALAAVYGSSEAGIRAFRRMSARDAVITFFERNADALDRSRIAAHVAPSRLAVANALAGRSDQALAWLERSQAERDPDLLVVLRDPAFDSMSTLPRYRSVVAATRRLERHSN